MRLRTTTTVKYTHKARRRHTSGRSGSTGALGNQPRAMLGRNKSTTCLASSVLLMSVCGGVLFGPLGNNRPMRRKSSSERVAWSAGVFVRSIILDIPGVGFEGNEGERRVYSCSVPQRKMRERRVRRVLRSRVPIAGAFVGSPS